MQFNPTRSKRVFSFYDDAMSIIISEGTVRKQVYHHCRCCCQPKNSKKKTLRTHRTGK